MTSTVVAPLTVDVARSMVGVGGRWFPACGLVCPDHKKAPMVASDRALGEKSKYGLTVYVPLESGVLVSVDVEDATGRLGAHLLARSCSELWQYQEDPIWLPRDLRVDQGNVVPGWQDWDWCEPGWLAWHIDRVSNMGYVQPKGPLVECVPLATFMEPA